MILTGLYSFLTGGAESKEEISIEKLKKIIALEQERMKKLSEIGESTEFFFKEPKYKPALLEWKDMTPQEVSDSISDTSSILCDIKPTDFTADKLKEILMTEAGKCLSNDGKTDRGRLLWPLRAALSGREKSPGPFEIAEILDKEKTLKRIEQAKKLLKK